MQKSEKRKYSAVSELWKETDYKFPLPSETLVSKNLEYDLE